jgi:hypothetical protein
MKKFAKKSLTLLDAMLLQERACSRWISEHRVLPANTRHR